MINVAPKTSMYPGIVLVMTICATKAITISVVRSVETNEGDIMIRALKSMKNPIMPGN